MQKKKTAADYAGLWFDSNDSTYIQVTVVRHARWEEVTAVVEMENCFSFPASDEAGRQTSDVTDFDKIQNLVLDWKDRKSAT